LIDNFGEIHMSTINNIAKLVYDNAINAHRDQIEVLGLELEHASGVRAFAAEQAIRERGGWEHLDADLLFEACDELVGNDRLFESYDDGPNPDAGVGFVLGEGCPFMSLEAYLDLHELFGEGWLLLAAVEYASCWGGEELRDDPARKAAELVALAREEFARARATEFECYFTPVKVRVAAALAAKV
jgi:hypothetical protein